MVSVLVLNFWKIPHSVLLLYLHLLSKINVTDQTEDEKRKFMFFKETSTKQGLYIYNNIVIKTVALPLKF